jgi:hypothetical protein
MVKVFGCRQAYDNHPCTNPRIAMTVYGDFEFCSMVKPSVTDRATYGRKPPEAATGPRADVREPMLVSRWGDRVTVSRHDRQVAIRNPARLAANFAGMVTRRPRGIDYPGSRIR